MTRYAVEFEPGVKIDEVFDCLKVMDSDPVKDLWDQVEYFKVARDGYTISGQKSQGQVFLDVDDDTRLDLDNLPTFCKVFFAGKISSVVKIREGEQ